MTESESLLTDSDSVNHVVEMTAKLVSSEFFVFFCLGETDLLSIA